MEVGPRQQGASIVRWVVGAVLGAVVTSALSGCAFMPGVQYGPDDRPAVANGIDAHIASVKIRSFLIISTAEDAPGRFLGAIFNESEEPVTVTFADEDEELTVTVPGGGSHHFSEKPDGLDTVGDIPGARLQMTVSVGSETEDILPIILDGTLEQYRPYLPSSTE